MGCVWCVCVCVCVGGVMRDSRASQLSDGSPVALVEGGEGVRVTHDRREEFAGLVIKARLAEGARAARAIRKGFNAVVPLPSLALFSWWDGDMHSRMRAWHIRMRPQVGDRGACVRIAERGRGHAAAARRVRAPPPLPQRWDSHPLRRYQGGLTASHPVVKNLWAALRSFTVEERQVGGM